MSSILIKDGKIPQNYKEYDDMILSIIVGKANKETCAIIELPPHGRLIDADKLREAVLKWMPPDMCGHDDEYYGNYEFDSDICASMVMEIDNAPTVIEGEE